MIFGTGIDLVDIKKIKKTVGKWGKRFEQKIFTPMELNYCYQRKPPFQHLAARFAAKEAFLKALRRAERSGIKWKEIQVNNKKGGQPFYVLSGSAKSLMSEQGVKCFLTISHTGDYAVAHCLLDHTPAK